MAERNFRKPLEWWPEGLGRFLWTQCRRVSLGCLIGAILAIVMRLAARDSNSRLVPALQGGWHNLFSADSFEGIPAYKRELVLLVAAICALALPQTLGWVRRYARSWLAGITSLVTVFVASCSLLALTYGQSYPRLTLTAALVCVGGLVALEFWRQKARPASTARPDLRLNIPIRKAGLSPGSRWQADTSDDPITDWKDDIIGRVSVVELLAEHALHLRTPVVALLGGLGDGKTSVLNLFRNTIEEHAIVVSFSAWLPGSEATLAVDLFRDIASECRKYLVVPELRKRGLAFARVVSGSVGYLAGLRELIPTRSQKDELHELRQVIAQLPLPVVILLDEIDRMQKDEVLVLLKILRGAPSIPNVMFVCAFDREELERVTEESSEYLEKFFPVSVVLSPAPPELIGRCWQSELLRQLCEQKWFRGGQNEANFTHQLAELWTDALQRVCTNLRKAGLLLNDIAAAGRSISGEVNPLDLVAIQALARFYPRVYQKVRNGQVHLTDAKRNELFTRQEDGRAFFEGMKREIDQSKEPAAVREFLTWLFPEYEREGGRRMGARRPFSRENAESRSEYATAITFRFISGLRFRKRSSATLS